MLIFKVNEILCSMEIKTGIFNDLVLLVVENVLCDREDIMIYIETFSVIKIDRVRFSLSNPYMAFKSVYFPIKR